MALFRRRSRERPPPRSEPGGGRRARAAARKRAKKKRRAASTARRPRRSTTHPVLRLLRRAAFWQWFASALVYFIAFGTFQLAYTLPSGTILGMSPFLALTVAGPLVLVRRQALLAWAIGVGAAVVMALSMPLSWVTDWPWPVIQGLVMFALVFAVAAAERLWVAVTAVLATAVVWGIGVQTGKAGWIFAIVVIGLAGVLTGRLRRSRRALAEERQATLAEQASRVVLQERARIARDLHDIVAHHMSMVAIQAETARYRLSDVPPHVQEEFDSIGASAREALAETRALLSVLRGADDEAEHAPQPGVEQLLDLVDGAERTGMRVDAHLDCPPDGIRPGTQLTLYRIVQEGLANAARHAPGSLVRLRVQRRDDGVLIQLRNGPSTGDDRRRPLTEGTGHGLTGMRERVASEHGTIEAGPTEDGGFRITVHVPLSPVDEVPSAAPGAPDTVAALATDDEEGGA